MKLAYFLLVLVWIACLQAYQSHPPPSSSALNAPGTTAAKAPSQNPPSPGNMPRKDLAGPNANPGIAELDAMNPEQRQKALQSLSPRQREKVERQLKAYDSLSPAERLKLADQYRLFRQLPPAKQSKIRDAFNRLQKNTPERQQAIRGALDTLNALPPDQQREALNSAEFKNQFSRTERKTIEELLAVPRS